MEMHNEFDNLYRYIAWLIDIGADARIHWNGHLRV